MGTGYSFSVLDACDSIGVDYRTLTRDNFIVGIQSVPASSGSVSTSVGTETKSMTFNGCSLTKSYNNANGILTLSGYSLSARTNASNPITASSNGVCFAYLYVE